jgi:hypothetical protein
MFSPLQDGDDHYDDEEVRLTKKFLTEIVSWDGVGFLNECVGSTYVASSPEQRSVVPAAMFESGYDYKNVFYPLCVAEFRASAVGGFKAALEEASGPDQGYSGKGAKKGFVFGQKFSCTIKMKYLQTGSTGTGTLTLKVEGGKQFVDAAFASIKSDDTLCLICNSEAWFTSVMSGQSEGLQMPSVCFLGLAISRGGDGSVEISSTSESVSAAGELNSSLFMWPVSSITSHLREIEALAKSVHAGKIPLFPAIYKPTPRPLPSAAVSNERLSTLVPEKLPDFIRQNYNVSQQMAIVDAVANEGKITLIQGPPGTGKTKVVHIV